MQHCVAPAGVSPAVKGLLIASHFDAGLGSPGASDAASCIGVMLEMARALAADGNSTLAAPVVFLFNGGEETLSQVGSATALQRAACYTRCDAPSRDYFALMAGCLQDRQLAGACSCIIVQHTPLGGQLLNLTHPESVLASLQAAHGFMQHSAHAENLGAFINLESTGPAGPDFLFQSSGGQPSAPPPCV